MFKIHKKQIKEIDVNEFEIHDNNLLFIKDKNISCDINIDNSIFTIICSSKLSIMNKNSNVTEFTMNINKNNKLFLEQSLELKVECKKIGYMIAETDTESSFNHKGYDAFLFALTENKNLLFNVSRRKPYTECTPEWNLYHLYPNTNIKDILSGDGYIFILTEEDRLYLITQKTFWYIFNEKVYHTNKNNEYSLLIRYNVKSFTHNNNNSINILYNNLYEENIKWDSFHELCDLINDKINIPKSKKYYNLMDDNIKIKSYYIHDHNRSHNDIVRIDNYSGYFNQDDCI